MTRSPCPCYSWNGLRIELNSTDTGLVSAVLGLRGLWVVGDEPGADSGKLCSCKALVELRVAAAGRRDGAGISQNVVSQLLSFVI